VGSLWRGPSHQHRLADEQCRALGPGGRQGREVGGRGALVGSQGGRGAGVVAPRGLTSLGLLDLTCGEVHVGVAHPLPVELLLGPEEPLEHDGEFAL